MKPALVFPRSLAVSLAVLTLLTFAACGTPEKAPELPEPTPKLTLADLQLKLGIETPAGDSGYQEKLFDGCNLGDSLTELSDSIKDCHHVYFVFLRFKLSCRGTEESSSILEDSDLRVLVNRQLKWSIGRLAGHLQTDESGNGVIRALANSSMRRGFLRISTPGDFLVMRAGDATNVVTPPSWCDAH